MKKYYLFWIYLLCQFTSTFSYSSHLPTDIERNIAKSANVIVTNAYIRETIPGSTVSSMYMTINNNSDKSVTLIGASSKISPSIEIHEHTMSDGMMKMGQVQSIVIKAKSKVVLQPSGFHLMIFNVNTPLKDKQTAQVILHFKVQEPIQVLAPIVSIKHNTSHH